MASAPHRQGWLDTLISYLSLNLGLIQSPTVAVGGELLHSCQEGFGSEEPGKPGDFGERKVRLKAPFPQVARTITEVGNPCAERAP